PGVGPVGNPVGRVLVVATVPGQEGHAATGDLADGDRRGRRTVGGVDLDLLDLVEQRVEARAPVDAHVGPACARPGRGHAVLASVFVAVADPLEPSPDDELDEPLSPPELDELSELD